MAVLFVYREFKTFYDFLDKIETPDGVGGDVAEDVMGGLDMAVNKLKWHDSGTKVSAVLVNSQITLSLYWADVYVHIRVVPRQLTCRV